MSFDLIKLPWLRPPPPSFRAECRKLHELESGWGPAMQALAQHAMTDSEIAALSKARERVRQKVGGPIPELQRFRLGLISNATTKLITPALVASALRYGLDLEVVEAEFNQVMQAAVSPDSPVVSAEPNAILLALDATGYPGLETGVGDPGAAFEYLTMLRRGLAASFRGPLILQTVAAPFERLFGSFDAALSRSQRRRVAELNDALVGSLPGGSDLVVDVAALAEEIGTQHWFDPVQWHLAKLPFAQMCVPIYAEHCVRVIAALRGKSRKCLVLDCDNTLWGGVIGDDGMDGIVVGQGSAVGEAFLAVQRMALDLRDRGVVLAVSSKNEDRTARQVFQEHPEMLLREEHLSVFQANWSDKARNLEAIARTLNIGIDSLVFVDDNPAERQQVRLAQPHVAVPELGSDPALYVRHVMAAGYFESIAFSEEDRARADQYRDNARRASLLESATDLDSYLRSLKMVMTITPFDSVGRARISQLINKSNQFNLTTRRYTEAEVAQTEVDPAALHFQVRLTDTFGDNGMISVIVLRRRGDSPIWDIDTWLMSCRVLGRRVEEAVLNEIVAAVQRSGGERIIGAYHPTSKNEMVAQHYAKLGFELLETTEQKSTFWGLSVKDYQPRSVQMEIRGTP